MIKTADAKCPAPKNLFEIRGFARAKNRNAINKHRKIRTTISRNFNQPNRFASDFFKNFNDEKGIFLSLF